MNTQFRYYCKLFKGLVVTIGKIAEYHYVNLSTYEDSSTTSDAIGLNVNIYVNYR